MCYNEYKLMKLKLDLHPIYNDSRAIEQGLSGMFEQAIETRATSLEIIPGKGSGQLKKAVLRFLDQPEVKARYHRIEKDGENWGRLFVHFRWERLQTAKSPVLPPEKAEFVCFCCLAPSLIPVSVATLSEEGPETRLMDCPSCGSPNRLSLRADRSGAVQIQAEPGYSE